jgi:hypothetical protein
LQAFGVSAASSLADLFVIGGTIDAVGSTDPGITILPGPLASVPSLELAGRTALALLLAGIALVAAARRLGLRARGSR